MYYYFTEFFECLKTSMFERMSLWKLELIFWCFFELLTCWYIVYNYTYNIAYMKTCMFVYVYLLLYYRALGCFVLLFVMYLITWDSLFLFSFDQAFAFVWIFESMYAWMLEDAQAC